MNMRQITDEHGRSWEAVTVPRIVAHLRTGAALAFRPADAPDSQPIESTVDFNSPEAAASAIRTMSEKELRRRLLWARTDAGVS
jgi:hypothetical protein